MVVIVVMLLWAIWPGEWVGVILLWRVLVGGGDW